MLNLAPPSRGYPDNVHPHRIFPKNCSTERQLKPEEPRDVLLLRLRFEYANDAPKVALFGAHLGRMCGTDHTDIEFSNERA